ncbi:MAG TPA: ABC transporter ATP-binding protein [Pseudomonadales bacterium]|nr:ABC transporter ATP-binding protein [Pseudomonadales bacterium]
MNTNLLQGNALSFSIENVDIVRNIDVAVHEGELVGLIGPNGVGKSTLLRLLCGIEPPTHGTVQWQEKNLSDISMENRAKMLGYLAQGARAQWPVSVERVVELGRLPFQHLWQRNTPADRDAVEQAMQMTEITAYRNRIATTLSGGEQTLVMLARIFATQPQLIFADEPVATLDPYHQLHVMELLRSHAKNKNAGVVVLHDLELAARFCDRLYLFQHGTIFASGTPTEVLTRDNLRAVYGIESRINCSEDGINVTLVKRICEGHP